MSRYLGVSASTVEEILIRESRFKKCARQWVPHLLDAAHNKNRWLPAIELLKLLRERELFDFNDIPTTDES
jgi:hypothetical protein